MAATSTKTAPSDLITAIGLKSNSGKKAQKLKIKGTIPFRKNVLVNGVKKESSDGSPTPIPPSLDTESMDNFPAMYLDELDSIVCKHCKKFVLKRRCKEHIAGCLKSKQEKARKKKEAREAAQRAKERAERADDEDEDGEGSKSSKKRKAETGDDKDSKKKKKKEEPKAKTAKTKGPVDVEKQCGVTLPNGAQCARSLTCKSHSMGAKQAVPGRSLPYKILLQAYQKKNQAKQQRAAIDANAPLLHEDDLDPSLSGPVDSDEERDSVMTGIAQSLMRPQPLVERQLFFPARRKAQVIRMKEMLSNAMNGNRSGNMFAVSADSAHSSIMQSAMPDYNLPSAAPASATGSISIQGQSSMKAPPRKQSIEAPS